MTPAEITAYREYWAKRAHELGWALTPLRGKVPQIASWNTQPPPSIDQVVDWARRGNVGLRTGQASRVFVVDVDKGADVFALQLPPTITAVTGGGGIHYLFRAPDPCPGNSAGKLAAHIDTRGEGGQIVYAGSVHPETGEPYVWAEGLSPDDVPLAELPAAILEALTKPARPPAPAPQPSNVYPIADRYGRKALDEECARVASASEGERNQTLNRAAYSLGQLVGGGVLDQVTVEASLAAAAASCGLPDHEASATIRSGINAGRAEPRAPEPRYPSYPQSRPQSQPQTQTQAPPSDDFPEYSAPPETGLEFEPVLAFTDKQNGEVFARLFHDDLRYCPGLGWMRWTGTHWRTDDQGQAPRCAKRVAEYRMQQALQTQGEDRKRLIADAVKCEGAGRINATLQMAQSEEALLVPMDSLDRDPWMLNTLSGIVDLRTGQVSPTRRDALCSKVTNVPFDPKATCPGFLQFLDDVFHSDVQLILWLQRALGYSLTGLTREQCFFICHGTGSNGKSTLLELIRWVLGDYSADTPSDTFMARPIGREGSNDIARLRSSRFVTSVEAGESRRFDEELIKRMTGGDTVTARYLYREHFEFRPQLKLWFAANHRPEVRGTDRGIWRRIRLVPFEVNFEGRQDETLGERLREEGPGILTWLVEGAVEWAVTGLGHEARVSAATEAYRTESDTLGEFLADCCEDGDPGYYYETVNTLYTAYGEWCRKGGLRPMSAIRFSGRLQDRGYSRDRNMTSRLWRGLRLLPKEVGNP